MSGVGEPAQISALWRIHPEKLGPRAVKPWCGLTDGCCHMQLKAAAIYLLHPPALIRVYLKIKAGVQKGTATATQAFCLLMSSTAMIL